LTSETQETGIGGRSGASLLTTLAFGHSFVHFTGHAFVVLLAEIVTTLGLSPSATGIVMASRSLGGALSQFPMGMLADRFAAKRTYFMTAAILWFGFFYFLIGFMSDLFVIAALAACLGMGGALWHPPAIGMISSRFPERRASAMAMHGVGAGLGDFVGPNLVGILLVYVAWQTIFRWTLVPAILIALVFYLLMRGASAGETRGHTSMAEYFSALRDAARHRPLLLSVVAGSSRTGGQTILIAFLPLYSRDTLGLSTWWVGFIASLLLGLSLISQPVLGYISDRIGRKYTVLPTAILLTGVTPLFALTTGLVPLLAVVIVVGLIMFSTALLLNAYGLDIAPTELHSSITAAQFLSGLALGGVAPLVAGGIADVWGIESTFLIAAGLFSITAVMILFLPNVKSTRSAPKFGAS
jgi:MFS family permease